MDRMELTSLLCSVSAGGARHIGSFPEEMGFQRRTAEDYCAAGMLNIKKRGESD